VAERLTTKERQDPYVFVGFVLLCFATVLIVIVARGSWSTQSWTAIAAVATSVEAVGVLIALAYAKAQIDTTRAESRRQRREELVDRLETRFYDIVEPALEEHLYAYRDCWTVPLSLRLGLPESDQREASVEQFAARRTRLKDAGYAARFELNKLQRGFVLLGVPEPAEIAVTLNDIDRYSRRPRRTWMMMSGLAPILASRSEAPGEWPGVARSCLSCRVWWRWVGLISLLVGPVIWLWSLCSGTGCVGFACPVMAQRSR